MRFYSLFILTAVCIAPLNGAPVQSRIHKGTVDGFVDFLTAFWEYHPIRSLLPRARGSVRSRDTGNESEGKLPTGDKMPLNDEDVETERQAGGMQQVGSSETPEAETDAGIDWKDRRPFSTLWSYGLTGEHGVPGVRGAGSKDMLMTTQENLLVGLGAALPLGSLGAIGYCVSCEDPDNNVELGWDEGGDHGGHEMDVMGDETGEAENMIDSFLVDSEPRHLAFDVSGEDQGGMMESASPPPEELVGDVVEPVVLAAAV